MMDIDKYGRAKAIAAMVEASEKLKDALGGAQMAKDESLFSKIYKIQTELMDLASDLVKDK
jgi:hypothetical protein